MDFHEGNMDFLEEACAVSQISKTSMERLKRHCIEFKYYADGKQSGLTPPGNNS